MAWTVISSSTEKNEAWSEQAFKRLKGIVVNSSETDLLAFLDRLEKAQQINDRERGYILRARQWFVGGLDSSEQDAYMAHVDWCIREVVKVSTERELQFLSWLDAWVEAENNGPLAGWHI